MKYCSHCGEEINENAVICIKCGCNVSEAQAFTNTANVNDSVNAGLVILAVFFPLFGWIYWGIKAKEKPKQAKACGIAGIISFAVCMLIYAVLCIYAAAAIVMF